jgi:pimeloyl-ACP methyl ester carboxylesterase
VRTVLLALLTCLLLTSAADAGPARTHADPGCYDGWAFTEPGLSKFKSISIAGAQATDEWIVAPKAAPPAGKRYPGAVLLHGGGGNKCTLWWLARFLAGRGYISVVLTYDDQTTGVQASRTALKWLKPTTQGFRKYLAKNDNALIGYSLGAHVAVEVQQHPKALHLRTIVAIDALRRYVKNDYSAATTCNAAPSGQVKPVVPALGLGSETGCWPDPPAHPAEDKLAGFKWWKRFKVPAMQATLANSNHGDFGGEIHQGDFVHERQIHNSGYYIVSWLGVFLRANKSPYADLVDQTPGMNAPQITDVLTAKPGYGSAAFLPADGGWPGKTCADLRNCP